MTIKMPRSSLISTSSKYISLGDLSDRLVVVGKQNSNRSIGYATSMHLSDTSGIESNNYDGAITWIPVDFRRVFDIAKK